MGLEMVRWVGRYQRHCRALQPLGHQGYRLRNYKKDLPLHSGYTVLSCLRPDMWGHPPTGDTWTGWPRQCLPKHMRERLKRHMT